MVALCIKMNVLDVFVGLFDGWEESFQRALLETFCFVCFGLRNI